MKAYKTEISPTKTQAQMIRRYQGTCRFVYNLYIEINDKRYKEAKEKGEKCKLMSPSSFDHWIRHEYLKENPDKTWILEPPAKALKQAITDAYNAYLRFFKGHAEHPSFKKKNRSEIGVCFVRNDKKSPIECTESAQAKASDFQSLENED